jgi:hypothetical protein
MARGGHRLPKVSPGPPCLTLLRPAGGPPPKRPYGHFRGSPPAGRAACSRLLPPWKPHAVRLRMGSPIDLDKLDKPRVTGCHGRKARGGHGLSKLSLGPAMPKSSTPRGRATPETALWLCFRGSPPSEQAACGHLLPPWTPQAVRYAGERVRVRSVFYGGSRGPWLPTLSKILQGFVNALLFAQLAIWRI